MASWSSIARRIRVPLGFAFAVILSMARQANAGIDSDRRMPSSIPGLVMRGAGFGTYCRRTSNWPRVDPYAHTRNPLYLGSLLLAVVLL